MSFGGVICRGDHDQHISQYSTYVQHRDLIHDSAMLISRVVQVC